MKTVFPNRRLLSYVSFISAAVLVLLVFQIFSYQNDVNQGSKVLIRDAVIRERLERPQQEEPVISNNADGGLPQQQKEVDFVDLKAAPLNKEDFFCEDADEESEILVSNSFISYW